MTATGKAREGSRLEVRPIKALVVDDDERIRDLLAEILKANGYEVSCAADGTSALALTKDQQPDLVILDLVLPGMTGMAVCSALRAWFTGAILIVSGRGDESAIVEALDNGADDFVVKPFRANEILARMRALLRRAAQPPVNRGSVEIGSLTI